MESSKLAQSEYRMWHDYVAWYVHWQLCGKAELQRADQWYKQAPERVVENAGLKVLWDFNEHCDGNVKARRPNIILVEVPISSRRNREVVELNVYIHDQKQSSGSWNINVHTVHRGLGYVPL